MDHKMPIDFLSDSKRRLGLRLIQLKRVDSEAVQPNSHLSRESTQIEMIMQAKKLRPLTVHGLGLHDQASSERTVPRQADP